MSKTKWYARPIYLLVALALVLSLGIVALPMATQVSAQPAEVWVDDDFTTATPGWGTTHFATIQEGINAVAGGGTVNVAAGTYHEGLAINKPLTLEGENRDTTVIDGTGVSYGVETHYDYGICITAQSGVKIRNFTVQNFRIVDSRGGNPTALFFKSAGTQMEVSNVTIKNNLETGMRLGAVNPGISDSNFSDIILENNNNDAGADWTRMGTGLRFSYSSNNVFTNITVKGHHAGGILNWDQSNGNSFTNIDCNGNYIGIYFADSSTNTVAESVIKNNQKGIILWTSGESGYECDNNKIHLSSIVGNSDYGIRNVNAGIVDATNNWWGANDGPDDSSGDNAIQGSGDKISTNVDANPWIVLGISANPTSIAADGSSTSTIAADLNHNSDEAEVGDATNHIPDGTEIEFTTNAGSIGSTSTTKTTTNGIASAILTSSTTVETATVTAKAPPYGDPATVSTSVNFISNPGGITLVAAPVNILANGSSTSTITATVTTPGGNPVPNGTTVAFTTDHGTFASSTVTKQTIGGEATATLTSESSTETIIATVTATANGASDATAVFFIPAGGAEVTQSKTEFVSGNGSVDASATVDGIGTVGLEATGENIVTTATYEGNPGGVCPFTSGGNYYDVHLESVANVTSLSINFCPASEGQVIYYWDGASWVACENQVYTDGCIAVTITDETQPSLADMEGLPFGQGFPAPVGGEAYRINKVAVLAPWLALIAAIIAGTTVVMLRFRLLRRRGSSQ